MALVNLHPSPNGYGICLPSRKVVGSIPTGCFRSYSLMARTADCLSADLSSILSKIAIVYSANGVRITYARLWTDGRVWLNATVLKTVDGVSSFVRGFKSYSVRLLASNLLTYDDAGYY